MDRSTRSVLVFALSLATVRASADRLAVAPPRVTASHEVSNALKEQFRVSLSGGLVAAGHEVLPDEQIAVLMRRSPDLAACDTDTCFRRFGELVGADAVLRAAIEVLGSSNYQVRLEVYDVGDRGLLATVEDACTVCTVREANEALSRAAAEAGRRFTARVRPTPVAPVAVAPTVIAQPVPVEAAPRWTPRAKGMLAGGVTLLVLGAGGIGAGAALFATDHHSVLDGTFPDGSPRQETIYDRTPGAVLVSVGAVLVIVGSVLTSRAKVAHDHPHR